MSRVSIKQFANEIGLLSADDLRIRLDEAGIQLQSSEYLEDEEKLQFLKHLNKKRGDSGSVVARNRVDVRRRVSSELQIPVGTTTSNRRSRTVKTKKVNVETRRTRTYVKRSTIKKENTSEEEKVQKKEAELTQQDGPVSVVRKQPAKQEESPAATAAITSPLTTAEEKATTESANPVTVEPTPTVEKIVQQDDTPVEEKKKPVEKGSRKELHVASEKSGRRRPSKKTRRTRSVAIPRNKGQHKFEKPTDPIIRAVEIPDNITITELAQRMSVKASQLIKELMNLGMMASVNESIDQTTAEILVREMGHKPLLVNENAVEEELIQSSPQGDAVARAPVVTIMGHVDHGKTTLLDYIRKTQIADGEAGGITQHIGAYRVSIKQGDICFLDTPGHEAFSAMRARGAKLTDIIVIVVAADDGVKPQTEEAITHARNAEVPFIIAINKVDRENADVKRVQQELGQYGIVPEEWGGDTQCIPLSAKSGEGISNLLEGILLQTEILELKAVKTGIASAIVLESRLDRGKGAIASLLVQSGTLKKGDIILVDHLFGRIRAMTNDRGVTVASATPSTPVEVQGLPSPPAAGSQVFVIENERKAREIADLRERKFRENRIIRQQAVDHQDLLAQMEGQQKRTTLQLLVKADVQGSVEAICNALERLSNDEVSVTIVNSGVGGITESDVNLATATGSLVIGFNVRADSVARKQADTENLEIRYYSIIYEIIEDATDLINGLMVSKIREQIIGVAEVRDVFHSPTLGDIAGCLVTTGTVKREYPIRVLRDNIVIYEGELESLRRFKDDVKEVKSGTECGIGVKNYNNIRVGDQIEVFERIIDKKK